MAYDNIPSFSFKVTFDGIPFSFTKVNNLGGSIEIDTIVEGGANDSPVILRKPKRSPDMLVLERGLCTSLGDVGFALFKEGKKVDAISISVLRDGKTVRMFFVTGGVIVKREFSPMDALESGVMVQMLQIAHNGLTEVPLPFGI